MMATHTYVSQLIADRRDRKGLTQIDLAERMRIARNTISRWENGHNPPTGLQRKKLAKELGGTPGDYEWTDEDFARRDRLMQIRIEAAAHLRRLLAGEE